MWRPPGRDPWQGPVSGAVGSGLDRSLSPSLGDTDLHLSTPILLLSKLSHRQVK